MAGAARPLPLVEHPAALGISDPDGRGRVEPGADEGDNAGHLRRLEFERRHASRRACPDHPGEILVADGAPEQAAAKVDARNLVAIAAVALVALRPVQSAADRNVFLAVLSGMVLAQQLSTGRSGGKKPQQGGPAQEQRRP